MRFSLLWSLVLSAALRVDAASGNADPRTDVTAAQASDSARLLTGYLYPNPCKARCRPTLHAETDAAAERVEVRIFNLAGELVDTQTLTNPSAQAGRYVFEAPWEGASRVPSGVYIHVLRAYLNDRESKPLRGRFALIK